MCAFGNDIEFVQLPPKMMDLRKKMYKIILFHARHYAELWYNSLQTLLTFNGFYFPLRKK